MSDLNLAETPILAKLIEHVQRARVPLHVPGHKQGRLLPGRFGQWLGVAAKLDLTELPGLDNLHHATECILESERLAAQYYGSNTCLYSVNGSTAAVMAAIMGTTASDGQGRVLFLNSPHMSAWRGMVLTDAQATFAPVTFDSGCLVELPPTPAAVEQLLRSEQFSSVYVTSPTYPGVVAPIREIAEVVHRHGLPLIVDEAHGAHLGVVESLPQHSVQAGADIVIHSVHKMLPGLTQTAWIHLQGERVDPLRIQNALSLLQTTSPSYLLLASLDVAQAWLRTEASNVVRRGLSNLTLLKETEGADQSMVREPFRHWVPTGNLKESRRLQEFLQRQGMFVEYADALGVLSIFGLDAPKREIAVYQDALAQWEASKIQRMERDPSLAGVFALLATQRKSDVLPRQAYYSRQTWVDAQHAVGRLCAQPITPYPPGVPILWPGQEITADSVRVLQELAENGYEVHGLGKWGQWPVQVVE